MFAEAGVGTGKTIVYLLYAICYARYTGKPAIIACADETLIEQLVKEGDIAKLSEALGLSVDVRLAKSMDNYLCLRKLEDVMSGRAPEVVKMYTTNYRSLYSIMVRCKTLLTTVTENFRF